ncbi:MULTISPECIES: hypothetical protein [unclassified Streptomyces]|uniref:hypothetical protein n=1 Tax=unclassified Streptomyces TaxID=2593676 RepID=UPI002E1646FE|nr:MULTISPECIES: hypothetical protein [unclassified Streptomyces]WSR24495.1 hypothetical protein OG573_39075 [Streptomyces sp. NBC_01205]
MRVSGVLGCCGRRLRSARRRSARTSCVRWCWPDGARGPRPGVHRPASPGVTLVAAWTWQPFWAHGPLRRGPLEHLLRLVAQGRRAV